MTCSSPSSPHRRSPHARMLLIAVVLATLLGSFVAGAPRPTTVRAEETPIFVSADEMNRRALTARVLYELQRLPEDQRMTQLMQLKYATVTWTRRPQANASQLLANVGLAMQDYNAHMQGVDSRTRQLRLGVDFTAALAQDLANHLTYDSASATTELLTRYFVRDPAERLIGGIEYGNALSARETTAEHLGPREVQARLVSTFVEQSLAAGTAGGPSVFDALLAPLGVRHTDTIVTLRAQAPELAVGAIFQQVLPTGEAVVTTRGAVLRAAESDYQTTNAMVAQQLGLLDTIARQQDDIQQWMANQDAQAQAAQAAQTLAQQQQTRLAATQASLYLLSTLAGQIDPKVAHEITVASEAGMQIADGYRSYTQAVAAFGKGARAGSFYGSLIATGNIVGAAMSLFSLCSPGGTNPEAMTARQLGAIRQQIAQLRDEMHARFDHVDAQLNAIQAKLDYYFARVDFQLGTLHDDVTVIQQDLLDLQSRLTGLEQKLTAYLQDGFRQNLILEINGKLNYAATYGRDMPYQPDYTSAENLFYTWATDTARRANEAGPPTGARSTRPEDIYAELVGGSPDGTIDLDRNLNYLSELLPTLGLPRLTSGAQPLANPRTWALSSRAYLQLALEWPQHDRQIAGARLDQIIAVGDELAQALDSVSRTPPPQAPQANMALYDRLIANYNQHYDTLDQTIQGAERSVERQYKFDHGINPAIDLWGTVNQTFPQASDYPVQGQLTHCPTGTSGVWPFTAPPNVIATMDRTYIVAAALRLGSVDECYLNHVWVDAQTDWMRNPDGSVLCQLDTCYYTVRANIWVAIQNRYHGPNGTVVVNQRHLVTGVTGTSLCDRRFLLARVPRGGPTTPPAPPTDQGLLISLCGNPDLILRDNWEQGLRLRDVFAQQSVDSGIDSGSALADVTAHISQSLRGHQQAMSLLTATALDAPEALGAAALRVAGAKVLMEAFITLDLPHAVEMDDYLRSFLHGAQQLDDGNTIREGYHALAKRFSTLDQSVRDALRHSKDQRVGDLQLVLRGYLDAIQAGQYAESHRLIETTLAQLRIFRLARLRPLQLADLALSVQQPTRVENTPQQISYTIEVRNSGPNATTGVTVVDVLPAGLTLIAARPSQGICVPSGSAEPLPLGRYITCTLGMLAATGPGDLATIHIIVEPMSGGLFVHSLTVTGDEADPMVSNNRVSFTHTADPLVLQRWVFLPLLAR